MQNMDYRTAVEALRWYVDHGVDIVLGDEPIDRFGLKAAKPVPMMAPASASAGASQAAPAMTAPDHQALQVSSSAPLGAAEAVAEAVKIANAATSLDELRQGIADFDGIEIKKTASNLVFSDGDSNARVMVIGDVPGAEDDRAGQQFAGARGALLDKMFECIGLSRTAEEAENGLYVTSLLNWRPPGNRPPTPAEIMVSMPFIERHIALVKPEFIVLCGAVTGKALLGRSEGISRLRKTKHVYKALTEGLKDGVSGIPAAVTYHPDYLLETPVQKRAAWSDLLGMQAQIEGLTQRTGQEG